MNSNLMTGKARQIFLLYVDGLQNNFAFDLRSRTMVLLKNTTHTGPVFKNTHI
jgi:hypothetical protein